MLEALWVNRVISSARMVFELLQSGVLFRYLPSESRLFALSAARCRSKSARAPPCLAVAYTRGLK